MVRLVWLCAMCLSAIVTQAQVTLGDPHRNVYDIAVRDSLIGLVSEHTIEVWHVTSRKLVTTMSNPGQDIFTSISFAGKNIVTGTRAGEVAIWNLATAEKSIVLQPGNQGSVTAIDVNSVKELIAVAFSNNKVSVYSFLSLKEVVTFSNYNRDVTAVKFTRDNNALICGSGDGSVNVHDLETGVTTTLIEKNKRWVHALAISYDSSRLAIATNPDRLLLYTTSDRTKGFHQLAAERTAVDWIASMDYYRNNSQALATATFAGKIIIRTGFGSYKKKIKTIVNQIRFVPQVNTSMTLAIATNGKGLLLLEAVDMKSEK